MVIHLFSLYKTVNKKKKQKARNEKKKKVQRVYCKVHTCF